jgi:hypothetical protein
MRPLKRSSNGHESSDSFKGKQEERRREMNFSIKLMMQTAATVLLASAFVPTAHAQQVGIVPDRGERERQMREMIEREQREQETQLMLMMTEQLRRTAQPRSPRMAFAQIREDYVRIQVVNNDLAQAVAANSTLDLKLVAQSVAEIRKRADRLKDNLALPEPESGSAHSKVVVGAEAEQLKPALAALDIMILRMVRNPLFRNPKLVDARQSPQVRHDLDEIIELSGQLKKRSEQLSKAAQKSP